MGTTDVARAFFEAHLVQQVVLLAAGAMVISGLALYVVLTVVRGEKR